MTSSDASPDLLVERDGYVAVLRLNRPPANFFDRRLVASLADEIDRLSDDRSTRAVVIASSGKHFCAGADFATTATGDDRRAESHRLYAEGLRLFRSDLPIIAAVQGSAVGGGLGLACVADFRVASSGTRFWANFAQLGFHQGFGLSVTLPRIVGAQTAARMLVAAERVAGDAAYGLGLVDRLTLPGEEFHGAVALAHELSGLAPLAVRSIRETLRAGLAQEVAAALDREADEQARLWATEDGREGISASLKRRAPSFSGR